MRIHYHSRGAADIAPSDVRSRRWSSGAHTLRRERVIEEERESESRPTGDRGIMPVHGIKGFIPRLSGTRLCPQQLCSPQQQQTLRKRNRKLSISLLLSRLRASHSFPYSPVPSLCLPCAVSCARVPLLHSMMDAEGDEWTKRNEEESIRCSSSRMSSRSFGPRQKRTTPSPSQCVWRTCLCDPIARTDRFGRKEKR